MPKRTNDFQELVTLIRRALARDGDCVEESAMVKVQGLETEREIDILHRTADGFTTIKIAVEAKDEARKVDLTTLEELCAKYRGEGRVCVDKFIIVSRNGFTEGAIEKARLLDVPLMTLDEAKEFDWSRVGPEHSALRQTGVFQFRMAPHFDKISTVPPLPRNLEKEILQHGRVRCSRSKIDNKHDHGHLMCYVRRLTLESRDPRMLGLLKELEEGCKANPNGAGLNIGIPMPDGMVVRYKDVDYPLKELNVTIHAVNGKGELKHTPYHLQSTEGDGRLVHHLTAEVGNRRFSFVMPDGLKSKEISLKVDSKNPKERAEARKQQKKAKKAAEREQNKKA